MVNHNYFTQRDVERLEEQAVQIRQDIISMIHAAKAGHPGGSLSAVEMVTALYFHVLNIDPQNPRWADRDRFILSKGHSCPVLYAALARRGYFDPKELNTLRQYHSILQGHPDMNKTPGVDMTTGSLGQGTSLAVGMAVGDGIKGRPSRTYLIVGDGESNEGQVWEAAMFAAGKKVKNLFWLIDENKKQLDGTTDSVLPLFDLREKFEAFGFEALRVDGNDVEAVYNALTAPVGDRPRAIVLDTVKGRGIPEVEQMASNHSVTTDAETYDKWLAVLRAHLAELEERRS